VSCGRQVEGEVAQNHPSFGITGWVKGMNSGSGFGGG
jgi:hypothetical protein